MGISAVEMRSQGRLFCPFFEFHLIEDEAENGVIHGVPDLDDQQHDSDLGKVHALHGKVSGNKSCRDVVVNVLSDEVCPVA